MNRIWMAALLAALAGCSSSDDTSTVAYCTGFGAGAIHGQSCTNCAFNNAANASDGNLDTTASIVPNPGSTTSTFTMTATSTTDIAGGAVVGLWITQPGGLTGFTTEIRTYLNGDPTPVEELDVNTNGVTLGADEGTPAQGFIGMQTTEAFDQVVVERTSTYNSPNTPVYFVYEICADGGAD